MFSGMPAAPERSSSASRRPSLGARTRRLTGPRVAFFDVLGPDALVGAGEQVEQGKVRRQIGAEQHRQVTQGRGCRGTSSSAYTICSVGVCIRQYKRELTKKIRRIDQDQNSLPLVAIFVHLSGLRVCTETLGDTFAAGHDHVEPVED